VELNNAVKSHAIELRKHHGLKLPDAIIAATALTINATVLTNDQRLLSLSTLSTPSLALK
jgi:predicted nucleic acid-binding protein